MHLKIKYALNQDLIALDGRIYIGTFTIIDLKIVLQGIFLIMMFLEKSQNVDHEQWRAHIHRLVVSHNITRSNEFIWAKSN